MIWLYSIAGATGGYYALGKLFGTQAWGLKILEALLQAPFELLGELLSGLADALGD